MRRLTPVLITLSLLMACSNPTDPGILQGLWELETLEIDGVKEHHAPYYLQMNGDGSFALAKRSGDLRGFFSLKGNQIKFTSADTQWFNRQWTFEVLGDRIRLTGKGDYGGSPSLDLGPVGVLNSRLTFVPVKRVPDFQSFEDALLGKWELYRIRKSGRSEKLKDTWLALRKGAYALQGPDHFESGGASINTRYRKVFFEGQETAWNAWFFGDELRLSNASMGMEYSLRK